MKIFASTLVAILLTGCCGNEQVRQPVGIVVDKWMQSGTSGSGTSTRGSYVFTHTDPVYLLRVKTDIGDYVVSTKDGTIYHSKMIGDSLTIHVTYCCDNGEEIIELSFEGES